MADPQQYTGATYNAEMYKLPTETMSEYLARLAKLRAQGILGGGGMLDMKETPTVVTPEAQQPLGELVVRGVNEGSSEAANRIPERKTLEQMTAEAIARQTQMNSPRMVEGLGLFGAPLAYGAKELENLSDSMALEGYLNKVGYTDQYGEEARDALVDNPTAMLSLMSTGNLPAVGGFESYDMANYSPQTWGDFGGRVLDGFTSAVGDIGGIIGGLFGSASPSATATTAPQYMGFNFTPDPDMGFRTMEDVFNATTVGNTGSGNYDANTGGYVVGTSANRNPDGSYTIGTSYNSNDDGGYTVGTSSGSSPIAATNDSDSSSSSVSSNGGNADRGFSFGGW